MINDNTFEVREITHLHTQNPLRIENSSTECICGKIIVRSSQHNLIIPSFLNTPLCVRTSAHIRAHACMNPVGKEKNTIVSIETDC